MLGARAMPQKQSLVGSTWLAGARATLPLWPGGALFGVVYAVSARAAGLTPAQVLGMSALVHAGSAQFAAVNLIAGGAGPVAVVLATAITNARYLLIGASLAPYVAHRPRWWRAIFAYHLSDESYGLATARFLAGDGSPAYALGANLGMAPPWLAGAVVGVALGAALPDPARWGINLVGPLIFLSLLVPLLKTRRAVGVAVVSGALALVGLATLPGTWYLLLAGVGGSVVGALWERGEGRAV